MSSDLKPIKLYAHPGPNAWKVAIVLEELNIPYVLEFVDLSKIKQEPYISVNPNGRVPAIEDPNTGITLWESGAINYYLIEQYDTSNRLTYESSPAKYEVLQWVMFQMSGQGPYYGQASWFSNFHPEKLPSAFERYRQEVERVISVIDLHLTKTKSHYLVGDKCTYADLMFIPWGVAVPSLDKKDEILAERKYDMYKQWFQRITERPAVKKALAARQKASEQMKR